MSLGEKLRSARLKQQRTPSQIAAATRMKVQLVEAIEREDFSKIAAPIYGKGFIKLYAEEVGLDPAPLLEEYTARFVRGGRMSAAEGAKIAQASQPKPPQPDPVLAKPRPTEKPPAASEASVSPAQADEQQDADDRKRPVEKLLELARDGAMPKPGPEATPTPQTPSGEENPERDLFDDLVESKEDRDFGHQEKIARPKVSPRDVLKALKERLVKEVFQPCGELWTKGVLAVRTKSRAALAALREGRVRISMPKNIWTLRVGSQVKLISLLAGTVVIIVLLVSGLSNCGRDPDARSLPSDDPRIRQPLVTAIDPPDPYLE